MKKLISRAAFGAVALLFASVSMAATVTATPSAANVANGAAFSVTLNAASMPENGGASLAVSWDHALSTLNSVVLAVGTPFDFISPLAAVDATTSKFTVALNAGTVAAGGSYPVVTLNFTAAASGSGPANINIIDNGVEYCWGDPNNFVCYTGIQYTQAIVTIGQQVPVPAAVWMFGSGLGLLGLVRRRMTV